MLLRPPCPSLFPYTTLFRSLDLGRSDDRRRGRRRSGRGAHRSDRRHLCMSGGRDADSAAPCTAGTTRLQRTSPVAARSEEHTSELQSLRHLVCRLLLEKKKQ